MATAQQRYYAKNRANEEFQQKNRAMRKAYYDAHKEQEREKALARYYKRKEQQVIAGENPPAAVEV
jgi:hypothetical protein